MIAVKIEPDGHPHLVGIEGSSIADEISQMESHVGGYIKQIQLKDGGMMLMDEDGISKRLKLNIIASVLSGKDILGNVLIVGLDEHSQPETVLTNVPDQYFALLAISSI